MAVAQPTKPVETVETVAIRFVGDSGDGMQITGSQFTTSSALGGNDLATLPDFPAEIRAPAGTLYGVSGFQINFSSTDIYTPGDTLQALVAMNPAALKINLGDLETGGILIVNSDAFVPSNLKLAGYAENPLEDGSLHQYRLFTIPMTTLTREAVAKLELKTKDADRCKNMFALGLVSWLYDRPVEPTLEWFQEKWGKTDPKVAEANTLAFKAGYFFGETAEAFPAQYRVEKAKLAPGVYRKVRGNEATALGMIAAAARAGKPLFYGSYPITPASDILHELSRHKNFDVKTFQAEDEIAAMCAAIGAAYGGAFAATGTSGPGMALKTEAIGLAVMLELPMVIVNVQRGGPSTGLPTKTEQADLLQAVWGRNGECPVAVIAAQSPPDCFMAAYEAFQIAVKYMTPVILLTDGYLGNGAEPWRIPNVEDLPPIEVRHATDPATFQPYLRDEKLARPWAIPGTPGLAHRIGGLEKKDVTGEVCYDPANHQLMCELRARKVAGIVESLPEQTVMGPDSGELLVVSWGGTYGAVRTAVERAQRRGLSVAHAHLRYLNPFPRNLGTLLRSYKKILVPELNLGQLKMVLRAHYLVDAHGYGKIQGRPFTVAEVFAAIEKMIAESRL
ncbi:2-oxoacid:acceptor oxidoreductase subunit alpha [bacterium]|nr:2-oxoacid:acceptor oxidoreductase subunit alpha [bacterium]